MTNNSNFQDYTKHYSEDNLFKKILKHAQVAGIKVVYTGLLLYYAVQKPEMPTQTKAIIVGALGYFILPLDLIPDVAPAIGYADDLLALTSALAVAALYIDEEVKSKARGKLKDLFGEIDESKLIDVEEKIIN